MRFYSEDKEGVCSSVLLSKYLNISFLGGNYEFSKLVSDNEIAAIYIDVVPDNSDTFRLYKELCDSFEYDTSAGIIPIPIPCIEYYIIMALYSIRYNFNFKFAWLEVVLYCIINKVTLYKKLPPKSIGYSGSFYSFEKQCKLLLNNSSYELKNYDTVNSKDCVERNKVSWYLTDLYGLSMYDKCISIARKMPVVSFKGEVPEDFNAVTIQEVAKLRYSLMLDWVKLFKRIKLPDNWWEFEDYSGLYKLIDEQIKGD